MTRRIIRSIALATIAFAAVTAAWTPPARAQDLEPPPPVSTTPGTTTEGTETTPATNAAEESKDSGLGLEWVWINGDVGPAYADMSSFSASSLQIKQHSGSGVAAGMGAGVRLLFLSAGLRATNLQLSAFSLWELNAEAALHMRIWRVDAYFGARGGYLFDGGFNPNAVNLAAGGSPSNVQVHGIDVGPTLGLDVYLAHYISLGIDATAQFLFIQRPPVPIPQVPPQFQGMASAYEQMIMSNPLYQESGSSVGLGLLATAHLGVHF
jgi:hypothetical protein